MNLELKPGMLCVLQVGVDAVEAYEVELRSIVNGFNIGIVHRGDIMLLMERINSDNLGHDVSEWRVMHSHYGVCITSIHAKEDLFL